MTKNPARNAYEIVKANKLVVCKRCGEQNLAWVQLKSSGKWALVATCLKRPVYTGENQTPEAPQGYVYANKLHFHNCAESNYLKLAADLSDLKAKAYREISESGIISVIGVQKLESVFRQAEKFLLQLEGK